MEKDKPERLEKIMEQFRDMPVINTKTYTSKDGKYLINEVQIKTIKPTAYYEAIIRNKDKSYDQRKKEGEQNDGTDY